MRKRTHTLSLRNRPASRRYVVFAAAILASAAPALATDYTWDGGGGADQAWDLDANWNPNGVPTQSSIVTFRTGALIIDHSFVPPNYFASSLVFDTTGNIIMVGYSDNEFDYIPLQLTTGDITRTAASAGTHELDTPIVLHDHGIWNINGAGVLHVRAIQQSVAGLSLTKSGTGTLEIEFGGGTAGYSGGTFITAGILRAPGGNIAPGGITVSSGAAFELQPSGDSNRPLTLNGTGIAGAGALRSLGIGNWVGTVHLASNASIGAQGSPFTISGVIGDGGAARTLTKVGSGTLKLNGANTYTGVTTVSEGSLWVGNPAALGTNNVAVAQGASLVVAPGLTTGSNDALISGMGVNGRGALSNESGVGTWSGDVILVNNSSLGALAGELLITGSISQSGGTFGFTKVAPGTVTLANAGTFGGGVTVSEGLLKLRHTSALGSSTSLVISSTATLALQETLAAQPLTINRPLSLNGSGAAASGALRNISGNNTWSGPLTLQGNSTIGVEADQLTISGPITGSFNLTKAGPGILSLTSTQSLFGITTVNEGILDLAVSGALGSGGSVTISDGGTLRLQNNVFYNRVLRLNGGGASGLGAIHNPSGSNVWNANVTLQSDSTVNVEQGDLRIFGTISGAFDLTKIGPGKLTLGHANTYSGTINVNAGILNPQHINSIPTGSMAVVAPGAAVEIGGALSFTGGLSLSGSGIGGTGALRNLTSNNTWTGPITLASADAAIGADAGTQLTISGVISDGTSSLALTKVGPGRLVLSAANTYEGGTIINGGTLSIGADNRLGAAGGPVTINNGSRLLIPGTPTISRTFHINNGSIEVPSGFFVILSNSTVNGGFLRGSGEFLSAASTFRGATLLPGSTIHSEDGTVLDTFTNRGALTVAGEVLWDGGVNGSSGTIDLASGSLLATRAFSSDGVINIGPFSTLENTGNTLVSGGGSRITISSNGLLDLPDAPLALNGALLINNGTISGTTNVNFGSLAKGAGTFGPVNITDGGRFSPGNSPGSVTTGSTTWNSGGNYLVEISDALAGPGVGWDLWNIDGNLLINALSDPAGRFSIALTPLNGDAPGPAANFDPNRDYHWLILSAQNNLEPYLDRLWLDTSSFANHSAGVFSLSAASGDLYVNFTAIPEPASAILFACLSASTLLRRRPRFSAGLTKLCCDNGWSH